MKVDDVLLRIKELSHDIGTSSIMTNNALSSLISIVNDFNDLVCTEEECDDWKRIVTYKKTISPANIEEMIDEITDSLQDKTIEYIQENFDKHDIREYHGYMYQIIAEKASEIAEQILKDNYNLGSSLALFDYDSDAIINDVIKNLDYSVFDDAIEDIVNQSSSLSDKLADIGMSYNDFI